MVYLCRDKHADVQQEASVLCLHYQLSDHLRGIAFLPLQKTRFSVNYKRLADATLGSTLIYCLTKGVGTCMDSLCELISAVHFSLFVVPVQIDPDFPYPGDSFYASVRKGEGIPV